MMEQCIRNLFSEDIIFDEKLIYFKCEGEIASSIGVYNISNNYIVGYISLNMDCGEPFPERRCLDIKQIFNSGVWMDEQRGLFCKYGKTTIRVGFVLLNGVQLKIPLDLKQESIKSKVKEKSPKLHDKLIKWLNRIRAQK